MKPAQKKPWGRFAPYLGILSMAVLAALIIIASTLIFGRTARKAADETTVRLSRFYLEEIADRNVYEISAELNSNIAQLQRAVSRMRGMDFETDTSLREYLSLIQSLNGLDIFAVVDEDGMVYTPDNTFSGVSRFGFPPEPITQPRLFTTRNSQSRAMVLVAAPTEDFFFGSTHIVGCITGVDVDKIVTAQQIQGENNQVLCRLFNGDDGTCIVESEGRYADGSSVFDVWRNDCTFPDTFSCDDLIADWNNRAEGYVHYTAPEGSTYLYYKSVPGTNWMVSVRLRENAISTQILETSDKILNGSRVQLSVVIFVMLAVFVFVIWKVRKRNIEQFAREKEEQLLRQEAKANAEKLKLQEKLLQEEIAAHRQASVLQILSREYSSVYYVDLQEDVALPLRLSDVIMELYGLELNHPYFFRQLFETYARSSASPEEVETLLRFSDPAYLRQALKDEETITHLFRILRGGKELYVQLRVSRVEDGPDFRHIVQGFAIVDDAIRAQQEQQRALKEALAQAEQASRAKTTFLSNMSHDIRPPMNAIIGFTGIALKQETSPEVHSCLEKISESSEHLLTLINDVLDISRIESGKIKFSPVPADLTAITDTVLDITRGFLSNRDIAFRVQRVRLPHLYVLADVVRIREVLVNILSNAVKFTPDGGSITFVTSCRPGKDHRHIRVIYTVSDTGIGMSPEFLEHIFDEFSQEESSARTQYKGTGLGMAITKRYVELMGGTIAVESKKGVGSTFTVELPMELAEESRVQKEDAPVAGRTLGSLQGLRILLAEDNPLNMEIAVTLLGEAGAVITPATDGRAAVEAFSQSPPGTFDVILMDIMMPVMNGDEATRAIRSMASRPDAGHIPIIAMTANAFAEDIQESREAGMNAHLAKPLNMTRVISEISRLVSPAENGPHPES